MHAPPMQCHLPESVQFPDLTALKVIMTHLDVAVLIVQGAQVEQRLNPLFARLPDADEEPACVGHCGLPCCLNGEQPEVGILVRAIVVRHAGQHEAPGGGLQHQPLPCRHCAQRLHLD